MTKHYLSKLFHLSCITLVFICLLTGCASDKEVVFENDYLRLEKVDGLSYVFHEDDLGDGEVSYSISIYNQGYRCGWFGVRNAPMEGLQNDVQWQIFCAELSSQGAVELTAYEMADDIAQYTFAVSELPFSYGDTEWLVDAGVFEDIEEACRESCETKVVLWSKEGIDQGYYFWLNTLFISEEQTAKLAESVTFKEGAFTQDKVSEWLAAEGGVPSSGSSGENIFVPENASKLTYRIEADGQTYRVPEHTVALQVSDDSWELYGYTNDGTGAVKIGSIHLNDKGEIEVNTDVSP